MAYKPSGLTASLGFSLLPMKPPMPCKNKIYVVFLQWICPLSIKFTGPSHRSRKGGRTVSPFQQRPGPSWKQMSEMENEGGGEHPCLATSLMSLDTAEPEAVPGLPFLWVNNSPFLLQSHFEANRVLLFPPFYEEDAEFEKANHSPVAIVPLAKQGFSPRSVRAQSWRDPHDTIPLALPSVVFSGQRTSQQIWTVTFGQKTRMTRESAFLSVQGSWPHCGG